MFAGFLESSQFSEGRAEVEMGKDLAGREPNHLPEMRDRIVEPLQAEQNNSELLVGAHVLGISTQRLCVMRHGVLDSRDYPHTVPEGVERIGIGRIIVSPIIKATPRPVIGHLPHGPPRLRAGM